MKFRFTKMVGSTQFTFEGEAANPKEFVKQVAFYSAELPSVGPNKETDLVFRHRVAKGFDFYSIECPSANKEAQFGQLKEPKDQMFRKKWQVIKRIESKEDEPPINDTGVPF